MSGHEENNFNEMVMFLSIFKDDVAAKLTLEIEKKKLEIMKRELTLTSRRHSAKAHSSDEEEN